MGFLHETFPYMIVRSLGIKNVDRVVAYFDTKERADDYLAYMETVKKDYETYLCEETPENI